MEAFGISLFVNQLVIHVGRTLILAIQRSSAPSHNSYQQHVTPGTSEAALQTYTRKLYTGMESLVSFAAENWRMSWLSIIFILSKYGSRHPYTPSEMLRQRDL